MQANTNTDEDSSETTTAATCLLSGAIGRNGSNVFNAANLHARACQCSKCTLCTRAGSTSPCASGGTQLDVKSTNAELFATSGDVLGRKHRSVRRGLIAVRFHLHTACDAGPM